MKNNKIPNYVSSIVYIDSQTNKDNLNNIIKIDDFISEKFQYSQIILVNNNLNGDLIEKVNVIAKKLTSNVKIVHLNTLHKKELAQKAGIDICIGDFVYEFDTLDLDYDLNYITQLYDIATKNNHNLVSLQREKTSFFKKFFYRVLEKETNVSNLGTEPLRLVSRRMLNEVHSVNYVNRKVLYRATGLAHSEVKYSSKNKSNTSDKWVLLLETLFSHSNFLTKILFKLTALFFIATLISLIYVIYNMIFNTKLDHGWTSLMIVLLGSTSAIMLMLTFISKYLSILFQETNPNNYKISELEIIEPKMESEND